MLPFSEVMLGKWDFDTKFRKIFLSLRLKIMCLWVRYNKNYGKKLIFSPSSKSLKRGVVGSGSGSISQRCGSGSASICHGYPTLRLTLSWNS
jgi:hypothetical protein